MILSQQNTQTQTCIRPDSLFRFNSSIFNFSTFL